MGAEGDQGVLIDLPPGMMFFCETNQILDLNLLAIISNDKAVVTPEHLVNRTGDDAKAGLSKSVFERREDQVEAVFGVGEFPGFHVIARVIIELDLLKFVNAVVQDECIFASLGEITKAQTHVQAERAPVRQET